MQSGLTISRRLTDDVRFADQSRQAVLIADARALPTALCSTRPLLSSGLPKHRRPVVGPRDGEYVAGAQAYRQIAKKLMKDVVV